LGLRIVEDVVKDFLDRFGVYRVELSLHVEKETVIPPFSSSVVKSIVQSSVEWGFLNEYYRRFRSPRRVGFSTIALNEKKLYKKDETGDPLRLFPGKIYHASITIVEEGSEGIIDKVIELGDGKTATPYGNITFIVREIRSLGRDYIVFKREKKRFFGPIKIVFRTPTLLTQKLMSPPWIGERRQRLKEMHRLLPTPSLLTASMLRYIIGIQNLKREPYILFPYYVGRIMDLGIVEVNHELKPTTAFYGKNEKGGSRKPRGFTGWVEYVGDKSRIWSLFVNLIRIGEYVGIGRSRSSGFGEISLFLTK